MDTQNVKVIILTKRGFKSKTGDNLLEVFMLEVESKNLIRQIFEESIYTQLFENCFDYSSETPFVYDLTVEVESKGLYSKSVVKSVKLYGNAEIVISEIEE